MLLPFRGLLLILMIIILKVLLFIITSFFFFFSYYFISNLNFYSSATNFLIPPSSPFHSPLLDDLGESVTGGGRGNRQINPKYAHYGDMRKDVVLTKEEFVAALKKMDIILEEKEYDELFGRLMTLEGEKLIILSGMKVFLIFF